MIGGKVENLDNGYKDIISLKNFRNPGKLEYHSGQKIFDNASIFINTSNPFGDGFPNTYIECWLRGIPTISLGFDPDGIIATNNLGYVEKNVEQMADKIVHLFSNYNVYKDFYNNSKNYYKKHHSIELMTNGFLEKIKLLN